MPIESSTSLQAINGSTNIEELTIIIGSQYSDNFDDTVGGDGDVGGTLQTDPQGGILASYMRMNATVVPGTGAITLTYAATTV